MSLVGTQLQSFSVEAFQGFEFKKITDADLKGKWSVVFFYPADFTFVCPTELEDLADNYAEFKKIVWPERASVVRNTTAVKFIPFPPIHTSHTRPGTILPRPSRKSNSRCSAIRQAR